MYTQRIDSIKQQLKETQHELTELRAMMDFETRNADDWLCEEIDLDKVIYQQTMKVETIESAISFVEAQLEKIERLINHANQIDTRLDCIMPYRPNSPEAQRLKKDADKAEQDIELTFELISVALNY